MKSKALANLLTLAFTLFASPAILSAQAAPAIAPDPATQLPAPIADPAPPAAAPADPTAPPATPETTPQAPSDAGPTPPTPPTPAPPSAPTSRPAVNLPIERGRLGAYIPVTSANTPMGFHPDFAKQGGWEGFARDMETRLREGRFTTALVWRPHGKRPNGDMPMDAMLYLDPTSADPIERAAADEREFVSAIKRVKAVLDSNAGAKGRGELWVYLGNVYQPGENKLPLKLLPAEDRIKRIKRVLHPLRVAGVDGVAIDAAGGAVKGSVEEQTAQLILDEGFAMTGYEGWAEKGKSEHWCDDQRYTGFLMSYWYSERAKFYPDRSQVRGRLALINTGAPGQRKWATTKEESVAFIREATTNGFDVYADIWSLSEMIKAGKRDRE